MHVRMVGVGVARARHSRRRPAANGVSFAHTTTLPSLTLDLERDKTN